MKSDWPAWRYGPNGQSEVFTETSAVPEGWEDHPSKVITPERTGSKPMPPKTDAIPAAQRGAKPLPAKNDAAPEATGSKTGDTDDKSNTLDRDGWPWDPKLHAATQSLTSQGVWRMRVGVSRPEPKEGFPKPNQPLDL